MGGQHDQGLWETQVLSKEAQGKEDGLGRHCVAEDRQEDGERWGCGGETSSILFPVPELPGAALHGQAVHALFALVCYCVCVCVF